MNKINLRFQPISKERFEAYFYGRNPFVRNFSTELEWFSYESGDIQLLATMLRCEIDKDFNAIVLGRDLRKKYRAIHTIVSKPSREELLAELDKSIDDLVASHVEGYFPQGDDGDLPFSLFTQRIHQDKRNHYLKILTEDPDYFPARIMMEELAYWFKDPDGMFIRAMQGNEFNSRLFELYLHALFYELDFDSDRTHPYPDFLVTKAGYTLAIEAVTVAEIEEEKGRKVIFDEEEQERLRIHIKQVMPFKFANALRKKVNHRPEPAKLHYWELPHTKGHPFIIAIHDYSRTMSMCFSGSALHSYLYGVDEKDGKIIKIDKHENGTRQIRSNFFEHSSNKYVSAVMLVTQATLPKFNRMGRIAGLYSPTTLAQVQGLRTNSEGIPTPFMMFAEHPDYKELWHDGVYIFHNPNAEIPLNPNLFPHVAHIFAHTEGTVTHHPANFNYNQLL